ncbi:MAG: glycosyl transferase [Firmicutes bacterium]|nr:glycosyl transferase [Bacillota bacterium]
MEKILISVIIPTLNEQKHIAGLITSLLPEPGIEIIVSDGGSHDQTPDICRQYPVKFIDAARGRGSQLNAGAEAAQGDILLFLHADSEIGPDLFRQIRNATPGNIQWGCCKMQFSSRNFFYRMVAFGSNLRARCFNSCYGDQGIFCSRELFFLSGGYPDIPLFEDLALSHKLRRYGRANILSARVKTSTRRFQAQGPMRTLLKMQILKLFYYLGFNPQQLTVWYDAGGRRAL